MIDHEFNHFCFFAHVACFVLNEDTCLNYILLCLRSEIMSAHKGMHCFCTCCKFLFLISNFKWCWYAVCAVGLGMDALSQISLRIVVKFVIFFLMLIRDRPFNLKEGCVYGFVLQRKQFLSANLMGGNAPQRENIIFQINP